jgi:DNA repair protein RecN (Recombination protein N)
VQRSGSTFDELAKVDARMAELRQSIEPALIAIQDVSYSLRDYLGRVEANPVRLEEIEIRLETIDKLKRKYGKSVEKILAFSGRRDPQDRRSGKHRRASRKPAVRTEEARGAV